ncbi:MAG: hypothetical protein KIH63_001420 [Candidatus Saccharibacteria bacterium]|nr:hypothetical protein [Candidatus Saccharibacteria bacterium]
MRRVYSMEPHDGYSLDETLRLELAQARINHAIRSTQVLTQDFQAAVQKWQPQVDLQYGVMHNDSFPYAYTNEARAYLVRDRAEEQARLEEEAREIPMASNLYIGECYKVPVSDALISATGGSLARYALAHGLDEDASSLQHIVELGHRNRPADYTDVDLENESLNLIGVAVVVDKDQTFPRPEWAHVVVPELPDVQRFSRFCMRELDFGQNSEEFFDRQADLFAGSRLVVGTGFKEIYE